MMNIKKLEALNEARMKLKREYPNLSLKAFNKKWVVIRKRILDMYK